MDRELLEMYFGKELVDSTRKLLKEIATEHKKTENPIDIINEKGITWSYDVLTESIVDDFGPRALHMKVVVYIPGIARTGYGTYKLTKKEADNYGHKIALKNAINNALSTLGMDYTETVPVLKTNEPTPEPNIAANKPVQLEPSTQQTTPPKTNKFTAEQISKVGKLKEKLQIKTDEEFNKYLQRWNPEIKTKSQLNPDNIDSFINFMNG